MKFICNPEELSQALSIVSKAISNKTNVPILEGIKIFVEGDTVTLTATDLELFIEKKIKATVSLEGEAVVTGKFFTEFIRKLNSFSQIEIEKLGVKLIVKYGENETEIQCLEEDTYPEIKNIGEDAGFSIKECDLKETLEKTIFCVAVDDSRPIPKGCLLDLKGDELTTVALDGFRLSICKCEVADAMGDAKIVVPGKILGEITRIFEDSDNVVKVRIQKNNVLFDLGHTKITTRLIEGEYIQYEKIIPANSNSQIVVEKGALESGLDRASLIARNKKNNYLKLSISNGNVNISSNSDLGSIKENVACSLEGKDIDIAFNSKYLFEAFNKIKEDFIKISFIGSNAPAVVTPTDGEKYKFIILPVRLLG